MSLHRPESQRCVQIVHLYETIQCGFSKANKADHLSPILLSNSMVLFISYSDLIIRIPYDLVTYKTQDSSVLGRLPSTNGGLQCALRKGCGT